MKYDMRYFMDNGLNISVEDVNIENPKEFIKGIMESDIQIHTSDRNGSHNVVVIKHVKCIELTKRL